MTRRPGRGGPVSRGPGSAYRALRRAGGRPRSRGVDELTRDCVDRSSTAASVLLVVATLASGSSTARCGDFGPRPGRRTRGLAVGRPRHAATPDIFVILLDGYPRADVLDYAFDIDNAGVRRRARRARLRRRRVGHSDYLWTHVSVPSALNLAYVEQIPAMADVIEGRAAPADAPPRRSRTTSPSTSARDAWLHPRRRRSRDSRRSPRAWPTSTSTAVSSTSSRRACSPRPSPVTSSTSWLPTSLPPSSETEHHNLECCRGSRRAGPPPGLTFAHVRRRISPWCSARTAHRRGPDLRTSTPIRQ